VPELVEGTSLDVVSTCFDRLITVTQPHNAGAKKLTI